MEFAHGIIDLKKATTAVCSIRRDLLSKGGFTDGLGKAWAVVDSEQCDRASAACDSDQELTRAISGLLGIEPGIPENDFQ